MKSHWFLTLLLLLSAMNINCGSNTLSKTDDKSEYLKEKQDNKIEFSEERRLNRDVPLKEYLVLKTFEETLEVYTKLSDKRFSRSAPIPTLLDDEFLLVLKPKLIKKLYGDIDVIKIEDKNSVLTVFYQEIDNEEYSLNKEKNPIVILRLKGNAPSNVKLVSVKN